MPLENYFPQHLSISLRFLALNLWWVVVILLEIATGTFCILLPVYVSVLALGLIISTLILLRDETKYLYVLLILVPLGRTFAGFYFDTKWSNNGTIIPFFAPVLVFVLVTRTLIGLFSNNSANRTMIVPLLICFMYWAFVSLIWTDNKYHGIVILFILISNVSVFFTCVYAIQSEATLRTFLWFFVLFGAIISFLSVINLFFNFESMLFEWPILNDLSFKFGFSSSETRAYFLSYPNASAMFINLSIAITFGMLMTEKNRFRFVLLLGTLLLLLLSIFLTGSKGGLLGLLSMLGFILIAFRRFRRKLFSYSIVFGLILVILLTVVTYSQRHGRGYRIATSAFSNTAFNKTSSMTSRIKMWGQGWSELIHRSPCLGLGVGGFTHYCKPHPHPHSYYLSILFDFGIFGGLLLTMAIIIVARFLFSLLKHQDTYLQIMTIFLYSGLVSIGVHGLVDHSYIRGVIWLYSGILVATCLLTQKEIEESGCPT